MAFSSIELWQQIAAARLASPQQCRSWAAEVARHLPPIESVDGIRVLQALVELGKLTDYQARGLAGNSDHPLQRGSWIVRNVIDQGAWSGWWEVVRGPDFQSPVWSRWLNTSQLAELQSSAPSLKRPMQLAGLQHPNLQRVMMPIRDDAELQVLVEPVDGKLLSHRAGPVEWRTAAQLMLGVARGLAEIHRHGLVHGRVLPDRIALVASRPSAQNQREPNSSGADKPATERRPLLLCDPLAVATAVPDRTARGLVQEQLGKLQAEQFIAPEFLAPGQLPSPASDVYSLGCTWYWLLTGRPPATGKTPQETLASHISAPATLPAEVACGEKVARCLAHCLAKNLPARFASAVELVQALEQALLPTASQPVASQIQQVAVANAVVTPAAAADVAMKGLSPNKQPAAPAPDSRPVRITAEVVDVSVSEPRAAEALQPTTQAVSPKVKPQHGQPQQQPKQRPAETAPSVAPTKRSKQSILQMAATAPSELEASVANPTGKAPIAKASLEASTPATASASTKTRPKRRQGNPRLLILSAGVCGFALLLLALLKFSGALEPRSTADKENPTGTPTYRPKPSPTESVDPRSSVYTIVAAENHLWVPPKLPTPIPVELLPPGAELFLSCRPQQLLKQPELSGLLTTFSTELQTSLDWLAALAGQPLESIQQATIVGYDSPRGDGTPEYAVRFSLSQPRPLTELKESWKITSTLEIDGENLLVSGSGSAYYVPQATPGGTESIDAFSCGPSELMKGVAEFKGAAGPMTTAMEKLWRESDREADLCFQASPRFLYTGGRGLLEGSPPRLKQALNKVLNQDARGILVKSYLEPQWYLETQVIGATDRDAASLINQLQEQLAAAPAAVESWLVDSPPHPYWGAVAMRYPQMLRQFREFSRFGVENGVAIMNTYLPTDGGLNLTSATWIALQPTATMQGVAVAAADAAEAQPLTMEQLLERPIRLTFDQEPIEVALRLIAEEANADLPADSPTPRFVLDGDAFEKAGITRNQQLRNYRIENQPVRSALTEVAKRGNPVTTVTDTRQEDQKLIWVVAPDPEAPGRQMISLTTREAATAAGIPLPSEFAPN